MSVYQSTASVFTSLYLYGTGEKPVSIEDRLRDVGPNYTFDVTVAHTEYMNSVGRYAYASRSSIMNSSSTACSTAASPPRMISAFARLALENT